MFNTSIEYGLIVDCKSTIPLFIPQDCKSSGAEMEEDFTIYPNPSNGSFNLIMKYDGIYSVYGLGGNIIISETLVGAGNNEIILPDNVKGVFIVKVVSDDRVFNQKIIVR